MNFDLFTGTSEIIFCIKKKNYSIFVSLKDFQLNLITKGKYNWQLVAAILLGLVLLLFLCKKAILGSFTHDESYTYLRFVHQNFMDIISYKVAYTNNHILNTVLVKYFEMMLGNSEFALRLPNILAFVGYSAFIFLMLYKKQKWLFFLSFVLLTCNPYLLDFFTICRGYGLSIAFMLMSIYYLIKHFNGRNKKSLILFNLMAFLAFMSNFSLLNFYLSTVIVYNIILWIDLRLEKNRYTIKVFYQLNKINLIAFGLFTAVLYEPLRKISKVGLLDYGGKTGFIEDTVGSLVSGIFYEQPIHPNWHHFLKWLLVLLVVSVLGLILFKLFKKDRDFIQKNREMITVNFILLGIIMSSLLQHYFLKNDFYTQRFGLFFYPLFMLNLIFALNYVVQKGNNIVFVSFSLVLSLCLIWNVYKNFNTQYFKDWKYDADTKAVMTKLVEDHTTLPTPNKITLGINWLFEPSTNFYRYRWDVTWLNPTHRNGINTREHYFYIFANDSTVGEIQKEQIILTNTTSNSVLIKNLN